MVNYYLGDGVVDDATAELLGGIDIGVVLVMIVVCVVVCFCRMRKKKKKKKIQRDIEKAVHKLDGNFDIGEMKTIIACAAASIRHTAKLRPKMSQIVRAFEGNNSLDDLTEGVMQDGLDYNSARHEEDLIGLQRLAFESIIEEEEEEGGEIIKEEITEI